MAINRVDSASIQGGSGSIPVSPNEGELCIVICGAGRDGDGGIPTAGSDVTVGGVSFTEIGSNITGNPSLSMFYRLYDSSDAGSAPSISGLSGDSIGIAVVYSYIGSNEPLPTSGTLTQEGGSSATIDVNLDGLTAGYTQNTLIVAGVVEEEKDENLTDPTGWGDPFDGNTPTDGSRTSMTVWDIFPVTGSAPANNQGSGPGENWHTQSCWVQEDPATGEDKFANPEDVAVATDSVSTVLGVVDTATASDSVSPTVALSSDVSDSAAASDSVEFSIVLGIDDSAAASDDVDPLVGYAKDVSDTAATSDSVKTDSVLGISDSAAATDSVDPVSVLSREVTDSASASDSVFTGLVIGSSDSATADDSVGSAVSKSLSDASTSSDSISIDAVLSVEDTANSTDQVSRDIVVSSSDTATASDSVDADESTNVSPTDTADVSDSTSVDVVLSIEDTSAASDSVSSSGDQQEDVSDESDSSDSVSIDIALAVSDSAVASDSVSETESENEDVSDSASASDSISLVLVLSVSDSAAATDDHSISIQVSDSATVSDSVEATKESAGSVDYTENVSDPSSASDSVSTEKALTEDVSDTAAATDAASISLQASDTAAASDSASVQESRSVDPGDTAGASDSVGFDVIVSVSSSASASDSVAPSIEASDTAAASDSVDDILGRASSPSDTATASDSLFKVVFLTVSDLVAASDSSAEQTAKTADVSDSATASDEIDEIRGFLDTGTASDSVSTATTRGLDLTIPGIGTVSSELLTEVQALAILDVWNTALNTLGISTLTTTEGSNPQQTLLSNIFPLFRQQFLADHMWNGAKKTACLTAFSTDATENCVLDRWDKAFQLPSDVLRVWRLNGLENRPDHIGGNPNIYTNLWEIEILSISSVNHRTLLTNQSSATIEYAFDVGSNLDLLGPLTQHAMGISLAVYVATNFGKSTSEIAQLEGMAKDAILAAKGVDGQEGTPQMFGNTSLLGVRSLGY